MSPNLSPNPTEITFQEAFMTAKSALGRLAVLSQGFDLTPEYLLDAREHSPAGSTFKAELDEALGQLIDMPRKHLVEITRRAVAERNSDAIDQMDDTGRESAIFNESFLLSLLTAEEKAQVLGIRE